MYTFLVLGIIPGTNVAISFQAWLIIAAVLLMLSLAFYEQLRHAWELSKTGAPRLPLPASRLHQRIRQTVR